MSIKFFKIKGCNNNKKIIRSLLFNIIVIINILYEATIKISTG